MFGSLFNIMPDKQVMNLNVMRTGEKLVVSFQPLASNDTGATGSKLSPLVVTATPAELDSGFIAAITTPLQERYSMLINLEEFKKSTTNAAPKPKSETKPATGNSQKSKKEEQVEQAEKLFKAKNLPGAYGIYKKLYEQDKKDEKIANRMHEIWAAMSQGSIFDKEPQTTLVEEEQPQVTAEPEGAGQDTVTQADGDIVTEEEAPAVDMFAQMFNRANPDKKDEGGKVQDGNANTLTPQMVLPPGMTLEDYNKFLEFQKFQQMKQPADVPF